MATLEAISTGTTRPGRHGVLKRTAIDKRPVEGAVRIEPLGVTGDQIADLKHHGGFDQAVYAFAREDYSHWEVELGRPLAAGSFGENLTTIGVDVQGARIGERWQVGACLLEVTDVRIPCSTFAGFVDEPDWVRRFTANGVPGAYLRVIEPGEVAAGDGITIAETRPHDLTVGYAFLAATTRPELLPALAAEERLGRMLRGRVDKYLTRNR
ncbi:MAG TPA: MOSC domain-containing protein [Propionicimonas sp.]|uniref:MOSC domain-containing protein n=1 Tax=Propionicimonas sp. TaxID=1955623 RepID=UPI002F428461